MVTNPFILYGYESEKYFCDRKAETAELKRLVENGNNVALIAPRRIGKTGLIENLFHQKDIASHYYTFLVDIYATKNIEEMVLALSTSMLASLRPRGTKVMQQFVGLLASLRTGVSFDALGNPSWNLEVGNIKQPRTTLDEIFRYINEADRPCIVAIDEFQTVSTYSDTNTEAILRTYIQHCRNAQFIFSGSQRTMMGEIFNSPSRPFYQSTSAMNLGCIPTDEYTKFAQGHFASTGKCLSAETVALAYQRFEGVTWYVQRVMNELFSLTGQSEVCTPEMVDIAIGNILRANEFTYQSTLFQLPPKQKELLIAICKEVKAQNLTSSSFIRKYHLPGSSSVQSAIKGLLEKNFVTVSLGVYEVYDKFFALWISSLHRAS
ncbi:MAG: ATP-binding protein [Prevotella sp.]|nr:ATP-binding protein [Prevotella sp.]